MEQKNIKNFDIAKRQQATFDASVENAKIANDAIVKAQNWFLVLGLAELSFLGTIFLSDFQITCQVLFLIKFLIILLLSSFIIFIIASVLQYQYMLRVARFYEIISNNAIEYMSKGINELEKEPENLRLDRKQIKSNILTNYLFATVLLLILLATLGIIIIVFIF
jgi:hypothetical protein